MLIAEWLQNRQKVRQRANICSLHRHKTALLNVDVGSQVAERYCFVCCGNNLHFYGEHLRGSHINALIGVLLCKLKFKFDYPAMHAMEDTEISY